MLSPAESRASLWLADPAERYPALPGHLTADVAVVGGGISGASLAWQLRRRGLSVVVVERARLAWGASGRNAGFLLVGLAEPYRALVERLGRERARAALEASRENHRGIAEAVEEDGLACGYLSRGSRLLA